MPCKGSSSQEEGFLWGHILQRKWGLESFWEKCLNQVRVTDKNYLNIERITSIYNLPDRMTVTGSREKIHCRSRLLSYCQAG